MKPVRLSPLDSSYLSMDGPVTVGHVCIMCPLDGPVTMEQLRSRVSERIDRLPAMRRRLQTTLVGLGRPWWVDDSDFHLDQHLFEVTLSGGGNDLELSKHVARIATGRLNRAHPLWEFHLVQGIQGGSTALVTKIHHAVMDGIGARDLLYDLFGQDELGPTGDTDTGSAADRDQDGVERWTPGPWPSELELLYRSIKDTQGWLGTVARFEYRATSAIVQGAEKAVGGVLGGVTGILRRGAEAARTSPDGSDLAAADQPAAPAKPDRSWWSIAPDSILNGPVSDARSYAFGSRDMPSSRPLRHSTATTVNDIVIAATAGGLRAWLQEHDAVPDEPLVAMIPIGGRTAPGREDVGGNRLALTLCTMPTQLDDPYERLMFSHEAMARAKNTPSLDESLLEDLFRVTAPGLTSLTVEAFYRLHLATRIRFPYNLVITNVPGSPRPLGIGEATVTGLHPCPPLSDTIGLNLAVHGYRDRLCFGISACPDLLPNVGHLMALILRSHDDLLALGPELVDEQPGQPQAPEAEEGPAPGPPPAPGRNGRRRTGPKRSATVTAPARRRR